MRLGFIDSPNLQPKDLFIISESDNFSFELIRTTENLNKFSPTEDKHVYELVNFYSSFFNGLFNLKEKSSFKPKEITFFGGSFNPWHSGHSACTALLDKHLNEDHELIILPDINPWKNNQFMDLISRWSIFQKILDESEHLVYPNFLFLDEKNPTFKWLEPLSQARQGLNLNLLIGFDSFCSIEKWFESYKLLELLSGLYIASRNDNRTLRELKQAKYKSINPDLEMTFLGHHPYENLSSTKLRQNNRK